MLAKKQERGPLLCLVMCVTKHFEVDTDSLIGTLLMRKNLTKNFPIVKI